MKNIHINKLTIAVSLAFMFISCVVLVPEMVGTKGPLEEWQVVLYCTSILMVVFVMLLGILAYFPCLIIISDERLVVWYLYLRRKTINVSDIKEVRYPVTKIQLDRPYVVFEIHLNDGQVFTSEDAYINMRGYLLDLKCMLERQSGHKA